MRFYKDRLGRTRPITARGIDYDTFVRLRNEDAFRKRLVSHASARQNDSVSTRFKKLLKQLTPDRIELQLSGQLVFLKASANFTWDLAKRSLEEHLTERQKMAFLKSYYGL